MRKTAFVVLALALVGIVAAAGCISTETQSPEGYWTLPGTDVLMTITPEGSVLGKAPVNLFSGFCTVEGDRISFNIGATLMTDSEEERAFFAALNSADSFKIVDGCVVLKDFSITKMAGSEDDMRHEASFLEKLEAEEYTFVIDSFLFGSDGNTMLHIFFRV